jgi:SPP1 family predicted phage head-tail adaptor
MTYRPMGGFRVGSMRQRITLQTPTESTSTFGDVSTTWADTLKDEPAQFISTNGGETLRGRQVEAGINAVFTVHYRSQYSPTCRIVYDGTTYGVVYVRPVDGGRRYLEVYCKS